MATNPTVFGLNLSLNLISINITSFNQPFNWRRLWRFQCCAIHQSFKWSIVRPCGMLVSFHLRHEQFSNIKGNTSLVCSYAQRYCTCKWVSAAVRSSYCVWPTQGNGELQIFPYFTHYRPFPLFLYNMCYRSDILFLFLGAFIFCVNNLKRTADILMIPWRWQAWNASIN